MVINPVQLAQSIIQNNLKANVPNAPWTVPAIQAIMNGDSKSGEMIANNLLQSYGLTKEEAMQIVAEKLNIRL